MTATQAPTPGPLSGDDELIERGLRSIRTYDAVRSLRDALTATTARLTGYDWNADSDAITKQQGDAFAAADRVFFDLEAAVASHPEIDLPECEACNGTGKIEEPARTEGANQHSTCVRSCDECDGCGFAPDERLAPTAPVEASGSELLPCPFCGGEAEIVHLDDGDNVGGSCVCCTKCQASGNVEFGRKENFVENWNRRAALRPQPSGETREGLVYLADDAPVWADGIVTDGERVALAQKAEADYGGTYWATDDGGDGAVEWEPTHFIDMNALLSARPLALEGQQGVQERCQRCGGEVQGWLCQSCPAEFRENDDGHLVFDEDTTPARAEAQDEGAAGERDKRAWIDRWNAIEGAAQDALHTMSELLEAPNLKRMQYALGERRDALASALNLPEAGTAWMRPGHPTPTPAADDDRARIAADSDLVEKLARFLSPMDFQDFRRSSRNQHAANKAKTHYRKLAKRILKFRPIAEALAALKSEGK